MADIFISYKREERAMAKALAEVLTRKGYSVWWDVSLLSGDQFAKEIDAVLRKAKAAIVLWSEKSIESHWVLEEADLARRLGIIVPVLIEPVEPPFGFGNLHTESLIGWSGETDAPAVQSILAAVQKKAGPPPAPPRQTEAAVEQALDAFAVEAEYWRSISLATPQRPEEYEAYLDRFGTGAQFAGLARARIERLKAARPGRDSGRGAKLAGGLLATAAAIVTIVVSVPPLLPHPQYRPGQTFRDTLSGGGQGPEMVVIPSGEFRRGSPDSEPGRGSNEGPQRTVRIGYQFAAGTYEVTWAEWEACVTDGGCNGAGPEGAGGDYGWGRGNRPVINVDWNDAQAYVQWLSRETGERYRLLSEAEWEYVARAGTTTPFYFGNTITPDQANYDGSYAYIGGPKGTYHKKTMPVGSYPRNAFGVHDMHGNVWEWVQDCWHENYNRAPRDGSAWMAANGGNCSRRVLRGGSWGSRPQILRSAIRNWSYPSYRFSRIGFRVARTL
ncbi:MAG: SUMF1/EgtB/PvdO family nonheme iron enzyme [Alphaproteobacteria bacterium]